MKKFLTTLLLTGSLIFPQTISFGQNAKKEIYITIDDGPKQNTEEILRVLGEKNKATFFMVGEILDTKKGFEKACTVLKKGHEIGNHSYSHPQFSKINFELVKEEILKTHKLIDSAYNEIGRKNPLLFRFPYGDMGFYYKDRKPLGSKEKQLKIRYFLGKMGYKVVGWDIDSEDWKHYSKDKKSLNEILKNLSFTQEGDTILIHDLPISSKELIPFYLSSERYSLKSIK